MKKLASNYLLKQKPLIKELINYLLEEYEFVSVLGVDATGTQFSINRSGVSISDSIWADRGYVVRVYHHSTYSEFAFNEINESKLDEIIAKIKQEIKIPEALKNNEYVKLTNYPLLEEENITASFIKNEEQTKHKLEPKEIVDKLNSIQDKAFKYNELLVNFILSFEQVNISKIYLSKNKDLEQSYTWGTASMVSLVKKDDDMKYYYDGFSGLKPLELLDDLENNYKKVIDYSVKLLDAKTIKPGVYDIICSPDITGLIAHEAFGHGVEMDMFVKNRAKAVEYLDKEVASKQVIMHDGAKAAEEVSSYAFDDEGTLASDTIIINQGILKTGISDTLSALRLHTKPTGNGKRQSYDRKAYSRMTNTFFQPGEDKLEDMIKSIEHGYLITGTMSGMEDPKNWGIQCVAMMGQEIVDGKLTDHFVSPVYMTGYVPDLLKSISMVSNDMQLFGTGYCGKGYKELVKVSDGGPYIKARVRIG